jgi:hypothetical protein
MATMAVKRLPIACNKSATAMFKIAAVDAGGIASPPLEAIDLKLRAEPKWWVQPGAGLTVQAMPTAVFSKQLVEGKEKTVDKRFQWVIDLSLVPCIGPLCDKSFPVRPALDLHVNPSEKDRAAGFGGSLIFADFLRLGGGVSFIKSQDADDDHKDVYGPQGYFSIGLIALPPFTAEAK